MSRLENNIKLLDIIKSEAYKYPDMRFHQLLWAMGVTTGEDQFYEESSTTLERTKTVLKNK